MATTFSEIYDRAIFRFADYDFLTQDISTREDILQKYLLSAKTDFAPVCNIDLNNYDLSLCQFNDTLGDEEIEILALGISFYWVSYKTLDSKALKNVLNSKDYYYYSPANLLKEVQTLRETLRSEFYAKMRRYSFRNNSLQSLEP